MREREGHWVSSLRRGSAKEDLLAAQPYVGLDVLWKGFTRLGDHRFPLHDPEFSEQIMVR